jgi:hypothetical protein
MGCATRSRLSVELAAGVVLLFPSRRRRLPESMLPRPRRPQLEWPPGGRCLLILAASQLEEDCT